MCSSPLTSKVALTFLFATTIKLFKNLSALGVLRSDPSMYVWGLFCNVEDFTNKGLCNCQQGKDSCLQIMNGDRQITETIIALSLFFNKVVGLRPAKDRLAPITKF